MTNKFFLLYNSGLTFPPLPNYNYHNKIHLQSRFNKYLYFPDYNGEELMAMFRMRCKKNGYRLTEEAETYAKEFFEDMYKNRDDNFGNGRDVRNRFEDIISRQANRLAAMEAPTKDDLMTITKEDFLVSAEE